VPGAYAELPVKGFAVWDSHAFNPTRFDSSLEQWMNVEFAAPEERLYPRQTLFVTQDIFGMDCGPLNRAPDCGSRTYGDPLYQRFAADALLRFDGEDEAERE